MRCLVVLRVITIVAALGLLFDVPARDLEQAPRRPLVPKRPRSRSDEGWQASGLERRQVPPAREGAGRTGRPGRLSLPDRRCHDPSDHRFGGDGGGAGRRGCRVPAPTQGPTTDPGSSGNAPRAPRGFGAGWRCAPRAVTASAGTPRPPPQGAGRWAGRGKSPASGGSRRGRAVRRAARRRHIEGRPGDGTATGHPGRTGGAPTRPSPAAQASASAVVLSRCVRRPDDPLRRVLRIGLEPVGEYVPRISVRRAGRRCSRSGSPGEQDEAGAGNGEHRVRFPGGARPRSRGASQDARNGRGARVRGDADTAAAGGTKLWRASHQGGGA
jgi:hypothetical protein